jgi:hypothetical protein
MPDMKTTFSIWRWAALLLLLAAGCATPERRIRQNPQLFASFPPQVQANVRKGVVDVGYNRDMVRMALGRPDRIYQRKTDKGQVEIWAYTDVRYAAAYQPVAVPYWYRTPRGHLRMTHDWAWVDVEHRYEYEILRVEFVGDTVAAIETAH